MNLFLWWEGRGNGFNGLFVFYSYNRISGCISIDKYQEMNQQVNKKAKIKIDIQNVEQFPAFNG